ncbi:MAG: class I SAM-dependent methyltransferase [Chthoniobacterales bacterium]
MNTAGLPPAQGRTSGDSGDQGNLTLDALERAPRFNRWMYEAVKPWLGQRIAELGAGKGNLSNFFRHHGALLLTDYRDDYLAGLRARFADADRLEFAKLDMSRAEDFETLRPFHPDTAVFLNVLEHIEDDRLVLQRLYDVLPPGCRVVVLVPYNMRLYSGFDRELGHFRRYAKGELEGKMEEAGLKVLRQFFFNRAGTLAWYLANTLGRRRSLTPTQLSLYNFFTPVLQKLDPILPLSGLSTIVVAEKTEDQKTASLPR